MSDVIKLSLNRRLNIVLKDDFIYEDKFEEAEEDSFKKAAEAEFTRGLEEGERLTSLKLEKEYSGKLVNRIEYFQNIISAIDEKLNSLDKDFEKLVISLSCLIAEKIIQRESEAKSFVISTLRDSLKKILGANNLKVKANPEDIEIVVRESKGLLLEESFSKIQFEADERVEKGGCFIETEIGNVDARISTQLSEIKRNLEDYIAEL